MMIIAQNIKLSMIIITDILVKFNLFLLSSNRVRISKQRRTAGKVSILSVDSLCGLCYVNYQKGPQQYVSIITDTCLLAVLQHHPDDHEARNLMDSIDAIIPTQNKDQKSTKKKKRKSTLVSITFTCRSRHYFLLT